MYQMLFLSAAWRAALDAILISDINSLEHTSILNHSLGGETLVCREATSRARVFGNTLRVLRQTSTA